MDAPLKRRMENLGATVHVVREPGVTGGFQQARMGSRCIPAVEIQ